MTQEQIFTSDSGTPIESDDASLAAGIEGPLVLHDHILVEKLAHFNRERVPERVVHAKGGGAFGELVITRDVSAYTKADFLQPGKTTNMLARFSSVAGEQGSPDTWRDVRGFALKFYTEAGNYDLVGNNTPVFFIKDPILFPDFIHSQKRLPDTSLRDAAMQWDFWTNRPESSHQVTILMSDRGIPKTWRNMDGFGSHTYQWINAKGERFWVKYHFKTMQGIDFFTQSEAEEMAGKNADWYRYDLFNAIAEKKFPMWKFMVQIMPVDEAEKYRFNPFDLTKVWSHKDYPLQEVGHFILNKNPDNFFAQIEQAAFSPANIVPGIGFSPDKMLLGRVFAYADAQRYRIGANHMQLPVNAPITPINSYSRDGSMTYHYPASSTPMYHPNAVNKPTVHPELAGDTGEWNFESAISRSTYLPHPADDDYSQPRALIEEVLDEAARERLVDNIYAATNQGNIPDELKQRVIHYWTNISSGTGAAVAKKLA